mmetsp:Transcript_4903/g.12101  ORF Transcript_4903/g.12101 Transcript_4903/m.12101 type:complete len:204 (-) Transcript_4903:1274-1885(-)
MWRRCPSTTSRPMGRAAKEVRAVKHRRSLRWRDTGSSLRTCAPSSTTTTGSRTCLGRAPTATSLRPSHTPRPTSGHRCPRKPRTDRRWRSSPGASPPSASRCQADRAHGRARPRRSWRAATSKRRPCAGPVSRRSGPCWRGWSTHTSSGSSKSSRRPSTYGSSWSSAEAASCMRASPSGCGEGGVPVSRKLLRACSTDRWCMP